MKIYRRLESYQQKRFSSPLCEEALSNLYYQLKEKELDKALASTEYTAWYGFYYIRIGYGKVRVLCFVDPCFDRGWHIDRCIDRYFDSVSDKVYFIEQQIDPIAVVDFTVESFYGKRVIKTKHIGKLGGKI